MKTSNLKQRQREVRRNTSIFCACSLLLLIWVFPNLGHNHIPVKINREIHGQSIPELVLQPTNCILYINLYLNCRQIDVTGRSERIASSSSSHSLEFCFVALNVKITSASHLSALILTFLHMEKGKKVWVFGYGSLVWKPGFKYGSSRLGFICGFDRRFWQGNTVQRGCSANPGRVATLVQNNQGRTWGRAFELIEVDTVTSLSYLDNREKTLGGYTSVVTNFFCKDSNEVFPVLVYIATPVNEQYLGPAPIQEIAHQVTQARGIYGHNVEYVLKLADYFRYELPEGLDDHLKRLEESTKRLLESMDIDFNTLMTSSFQDGDDETKGCTFNSRRGPLTNSKNESSSKEAFSSRIPSRSLKCVGV